MRFLLPLDARAPGSIATAEDAMDLILRRSAFTSLQDCTVKVGESDGRVLVTAFSCFGPSPPDAGAVLILGKNLHSGAGKRFLRVLYSRAKLAKTPLALPPQVTRTSKQTRRVALLDFP